MLANIKNPYLRKILSAIFILGAGFLLLNLTFIIYAIIMNGLSALLPGNLMGESEWFSPVTVYATSILFLVGYWFVFRSNMRVLFKATLMTIPAAIILILIGIFLSNWVIWMYSASAFVLILTLVIFAIKKQPWQYWFAVLSVAALILTMYLTDAEI